MQYTIQNLILHPHTDPDPGVIIKITPEVAGWDYLHFQVRRLAAGASWQFAPGDFEIALVVFKGSIKVDSNFGQWDHLGKRENVFSGFPEALYLPRQAQFTVKTEKDSEFAVAWAPADRDFPPRRISQEDIRVEIRGGDNVTRQINSIIPPGFGCQRLVVVEVYTPGGNWSSYPPHKHDVHRVDENGNLVEADLEEIYFYKIYPPEGFAYQRIYTGPTSPLQIAGKGFDALVLARDNDLVLVPEGHHPVVSAPGYTTYYLNVLAGDAQVLTAMDDPQYAWVKETWRGKDPRVPLYWRTS